MEKNNYKSMITCPHCAGEQQVVMPHDACLFFHQCETCQKIIKPKEGDCCVFCSYGIESCFPVKANQQCCK